MHEKNARWIAIAALTLVCIVTLPATAQEAIHIPVIINIYPNSNITEQEARDAINETNKILRQASMTLRVVKVNNPPGAGNGDNGDGDFTRTERDAMRTFGGNELENLPNQKGIKISFGKTPKVGSTTPGVCVHRNPTIIVKKRNNATNTGQTIAHEIGHVMTLGPRHRIEDTNGDGDWDDPGEKANGEGHTPNRPGDTGNGNIMAPSNRRVGTHLTEDQIAEMRSRRYVHGKCSSQWDDAYPATRDKTQFGTKTDDFGDHTGSSSIYDLDQIFLTSLHVTDQTGGDTSNISAQITVSGVMPTNGEINARYTLGFDIDADSQTGMTHGGLNGVDRIVYVDAQGNIMNAIVTGEIYDVSTGGVVALPNAPISVTEYELVDLDEAGDPAATSFLMDIPKNLIEFSAIEVPVVATAGTLDGSIHDTTCTFIFDTLRWENDPTLATFGTGVPTPGMSYPFEISGLDPNSPFDLYLDDRLVLSDTLDASGDYSGGFVFPGDLSNTEMYFLTAQDNTGEFAYSMTCPKVTEVPDLNGDGVVNFADVLVIISKWGPCPAPCPADLNGDGVANFADVLVIIANWGPCNPTPP